MKISENLPIIGVDIGGTKIKAGILNSSGELLCDPFTIPTGGNDYADIVFDRIVKSIETVLNNSGFQISNTAGIGLGVTGPLDLENGTILECPQLPTLNFFPLREMIRDRYPVQVFMDNDANALLLGESIWGAGKGYNITLGFTLGTGLGCALVKNKKLYTGANGLACEIWPSPYLDGTIEDIVSGAGISKIYYRLTNIKKTAREISLFASDGDSNAIEAWRIFGEALGYAVVWCINLTDPDIVILGGSIANAFDHFSGPINKIVSRYICPLPDRKTKIVKANLDDNAGFMGAAALVIQDPDS